MWIFPATWSVCKLTFVWLQRTSPHLWSWRFCLRRSIRKILLLLSDLALTGRREPEFLLANQYLFLLNRIFGVFFSAAPSHALCNGSNSIDEIARLSNNRVPIGTEDSVHLQEDKLHVTSAKQVPFLKTVINDFQISSTTRHNGVEIILSQKNHGKEEKKQKECSSNCFPFHEHEWSFGIWRIWSRSPS